MIMFLNNTYEVLHVMLCIHIQNEMIEVIGDILKDIRNSKYADWFFSSFHLVFGTSRMFLDFIAVERINR